MLLSIVFISYNRKKEVEFNINYLVNNLPSAINYEIIVADNNSKDGTKEYLSKIEKTFNNIKVILLKENSGIKAYNECFNIAKGEYLLVLDDDSHPEISGLLKAIDFMEHNKDVAIIAARILLSNGDIFKTWHLPDSDKICESFSFVGCGFLARKKDFANIGFFDEKLFLYNNEVDVSIILKKIGKKIIYLPFFKVTHRVNPSNRGTKRRLYFPTRNSLILIRKYAPNFWIESYMIISRVFIAFCSLLINRDVKSFFNGIISGLKTKIEKKPCKLEELGLFFKQNSLLHLHVHFSKL